MSENHELDSLKNRIQARIVPEGQVIAWWLGGAGFIFKTSGGTQLFIDPYLSDIVNDMFGLKRAFPSPITAEEAQPDFLICTHWHEDHLDPGAIPTLAKKNPQAQLLMPPSTMARALSWGVPRKQITPLKAGQTVTLKDIRVTAVAALHRAGIEGWEVEDAISLILEIAGIKIFFSGDTEYDTSLRRLRPLGIEAAFFSINGVTGNMNAYEAALLAWQWGATTLVPMHHHLWKDLPADAEATLDPKLLEATYLKLGGTGRMESPIVGGEIILSRASSNRIARANQE